MENCRILYQKYKSICNIVGQKSSIPEIDIYNLSKEELFDFFSLIKKEYKNLKNCYNKRFVYKEMCVPKENYDEGHIYQFQMLKQRMDYTSDLMNQIQKLLDSIKYGNLKYIRQIVDKNPHIWKSIVPLAIDYNNFRILNEARSQLKYLNFDDTNNLIQEYALNNDLPSLLEIPTSVSKILYYQNIGGPKIKDYLSRYLKRF